VRPADVPALLQKIYAPKPTDPPARFTLLLEDQVFVAKSALSLKAFVKGFGGDCV